MRFTALLFILSLSLMAGFSCNTYEETAADRQFEARVAYPEPPDSLYQDSMLDVMIGQMLIAGLVGTSINSEDDFLRAIREGKLGGVILYEKNIDPNNASTSLTFMVNELQRAATIPLFMTIDQEGGLVNRLKVKYGFPGSMKATELGAIDSLPLTYAYADSTAMTCKSLGINVNFAPVVDLCSYWENPIIAGVGRCYSDDPYKVADHATQVVKAHREHHVITVLKHFPGHGSSHADTHLGMADVTDYWTWDEVEPYRVMIENGMVDAVMTAHIVNRNLEPDNHPSTLSWNVQTGILRDSLGFRGVIFSDDMNMHAIASHYGVEEAFLMAINAGVDVLMFSNNIIDSETQTVDHIHAMIKQMVWDGDLTYERIALSYQRIMTLKGIFISE